MIGVLHRIRLSSSTPMIVALMGAIAFTFHACATEEASTRYRAEKRLFRAEKMRNVLLTSVSNENSELLNRTLDAYRGLVADYADEIGRVEGLEEVVIRAQMSIAEIEFDAGRLPEARDDFVKVLTLEQNAPAARISAHYSAAHLSEMIQDWARSVDLYEQFYDAYLSIAKAPSTAALNGSYLRVPLKLAELSGRIESEYSDTHWLQRAETLYRSMIESERDPVLLREVRLNLLTALIQQQKWDQALGYCTEYQQRYAETIDVAAIRFLEAKIYQTGKDDRRGASELCRRIYEDFPTSEEAPSAMLLDAALHLNWGDTEQAEKIYRRVVDVYPLHANSCVEAEWQLAQIADAENDWGEASRRYKSIVKRYPATRQALMAPLQIAIGYASRGEANAARSAYRRALDEYERIIDGPYQTPMKIVAEDYILQVHTRQQNWQEAIDHLLRLPDMYPQYERLQANYLTAAEIYKDELNDKSKAIETLRLCVERYPGSEMADMAQERIERWSDGNAK